MTPQPEARCGVIIPSDGRPCLGYEIGPYHHDKTHPQYHPFAPASTEQLEQVEAGERETIEVNGILIPADSADSELTCAECRQTWFIGHTENHSADCSKADAPASTGAGERVAERTACEVCTHAIHTHDFLGCAQIDDQGLCACRAYRNGKRDFEAVPAPAADAEGERKTTTINLPFWHEDYYPTLVKSQATTIAALIATLDVVNEGMTVETPEYVREAVAKALAPKEAAPSSGREPDSTHEVL